MVSPAKKRFEQVRAAREAAAAENLEKAQQEAKAKDQERAEAPARGRPNPYNRGEGGKPRPSPARKHFDRARAKAEASQATPARPQGDAYELHKAAIIEDTRRLADIQSIERKVEAKRELLPAYEDYVHGVLEGGKGQQDDVLMTLMVWYLDVGELKTAMDIAEYAVHHGLETPDRYQRSTAALVSEEVADFALKLEDDAENQAEVLEQLQRALAMFAEADMHDQIKAKLFKAEGYLLRATGKQATALASLERALKLNDKIGVKKDIESLKKDLKNSGD
jgi:tetratricopeptide (TPR) repeat protein